MKIPPGNFGRYRLDIGRSFQRSIQKFLREGRKEIDAEASPIRVEAGRVFLHIPREMDGMC